MMVGISFTALCTWVAIIKTAGIINEFIEHRSQRNKLSALRDDDARDVPD